MTLSQIFHSQAKTITFAAGLLILSAFVSRILGLVRNGLLSWKFGAGTETDIYFAAFRIPDFLFGILIMGGISAVFLPVFSEYFAKDEKEAWNFVSNVLTLLVFTLLVLAVVAFLAAPILIGLVAPGFDPEERDIAASLTRLMLLSPILFGISSVFSGVLQYFHKFVAYSLAPIMYNLGIIGGILFLVPLFGIWGLGWGVVVGAGMHLLVQVPAAARAGFSWHLVFNIWHPAIIKVFNLAVPRTIAAAGFHINLIIITALASLISTGSITIFNYANDMQHFPIGLIGVSFAVASFPSLSRLFAENDQSGFQKAFSTTLRQITFFVVPISLLLFLLRAQVIRLVYGAGDLFTWDETRLTAAVLGVFAFGILFQALIPFLARAFFSVQDTKTPTVISIISVLFNIILAFSLLSIFANQSNPFVISLISFLKLQGIDDVRILALPFALALSGAVQFSLLIFFFKRKMENVIQPEVYSSLIKTFLASLILVAATWGVLRLYGSIFELRTYVEVLVQFIVAGLAGTIAYATAASFLKSSEIQLVWRALRRQL